MEWAFAYKPLFSARAFLIDTLMDSGSSFSYLYAVFYFISTEHKW